MSQYRSPAVRRYVVRLACATGAYLVTLWLALRFVDSASGPLAYLLAALPGISVAAMFWAIGRLMIEEQDEYQRMLFVRQSLVATGFTLSIVTIWGFLENFDLVRHVDAFYIAILWFIGLAFGSIYNVLTLRSERNGA
jgi:hypothetical protein